MGGSTGSRYSGVAGGEGMVGEEEVAGEGEATDVFFFLEKKPILYDYRNGVGVKSEAVMIIRNGIRSKGAYVYTSTRLDI
jgi:hypothetical protein